jgi:hypothetical protein
MKNVAHSFPCIGIFSIVLVSLSASSASASSLVLVFRTEEASVIAADSKESWSQGLDGGLTCKIHVANDIVWATTGLHRQLNGPFDVWANAESAITMDGSLHAIVSQFESITADELKNLLYWLRAANPENYKEATRLPYVITSVFIKNDTVKVTYFLVPDRNAPENVQIVRHECPGADCPTGQLEIMMGEHGAIDAEIARYPDVWRNKGLVGAVNYLVGVQSAATPKLVAAPVAVLRIDKSGILTWLQKGTCG